MYKCGYNSLNLPENLFIRLVVLKSIDVIKSGHLVEPILVWCIGTCAKMFTSKDMLRCVPMLRGRELMLRIINALLAAGAHVPDSFDTLGTITGPVIVKFECQL